MKQRNRRLTELLSLPILAVLGFVLATVFAGVGVAGAITTTTTSTSTSTSTTTTSTSTSTTTTTTTTTPPGDEGCTPGYWKNHPEDFPDAYGTTTTLGSIFTGLSSTEGAMTLSEALSTGGGGLNALLRHAAAALLNAASDDVAYSYSIAEVVAMTNAAIASGSYEATKDLFDAANNGGAAGFCD